MSEIKFINGISAKKPPESIASFVKAKVSIKREELIETLKKSTDEWINLDLKESKEGKYYFQVNEWKPENKTSNSAPLDDNNNTPF